jgi:hypothetical protein
VLTVKSPASAGRVKCCPEGNHTSLLCDGVNELRSFTLSDPALRESRRVKDHRGTEDAHLPYTTEASAEKLWGLKCLPSRAAYEALGSS